MEKTKIYQTKTKGRVLAQAPVGLSCLNAAIGQEVLSSYTLFLAIKKKINFRNLNT